MLTSPTMPLEMEQGLVSTLRLKGVGYVRSRTVSISPTGTFQVRFEGQTGGLFPRVAVTCFR